jgi:hypothetical protein
MKLAVFVVLGLVASFIVGVLLDAMIEKTFPNRPTGDYPSLTTLLVLVPEQQMGASWHHTELLFHPATYVYGFF